MSRELREMVLARQYRQRQVAFAETLSYDNQLRSQVQQVTEYFNIGDSEWVGYALDTLEGMITPSMSDDEFEADTKRFEDSVEEVAVEAETTYYYRRKAAQEGCPGMVPKPWTRTGHLPIELQRQRFFVILSLLERKKLLLRETFSGGF